MLHHHFYHEVNCYFSQKLKRCSGELSKNIKQFHDVFSYRSLLLSLCLLGFVFVSNAQSFPSPSSCTSGDLTLDLATLPPNDPTNPCGCDEFRTLYLTINNKTGSTRTSFAFWGTLEVYDANGAMVSSTPISECFADIKASQPNTKPYSNKIEYKCNQSLKITNLFLAWTDASKKSVCPINPSTINPKCGTLPSIQILAGVDAELTVTDATCTTGGSVSLSLFGGKPPYTISVDGSAFTSTTTYNNLAAGQHVFLLKDANGCTTEKNRTINSTQAPTANAGADFTKTCASNPNGKEIGETPVNGFSYLWSPTEGLSDANIANPVANPDVTKKYTVKKTETATGCWATDDVDVTVNTEVPSGNIVDAGDLTVNCTTTSANLHASGGVTYLWTPSDGLSDANISNPVATPTLTTEYSVLVTGSNGCSSSGKIKVIVDDEKPAANAGSDATTNCTTTSTQLQASGGVAYSWSPATGLSQTNIANPVASPATDITYIVTVTGSNGCTQTDDVKVTVDKALPTADAGDDATLTCATTSTGLLATGGVSYSWSPGTGLSATNVANPTASPANTTEYEVTVTGTNGCTAKDKVLVTVSTTPPASPTICVSQPSLCGPTTGSVTITSPLGSDYKYSIDNGTTWQIEVDFTGLAAGSVSGVKVSSISTGCISSAVSCDASSCDPPPSPDKLVTETTPQQKTTITNAAAKTVIEFNDDETTAVKAFPNPFSDKVKFVINSTVAGQGDLVLYNQLGQKVRTVYSGRIVVGTQTIELNIPEKQNNQFVYVLSVAGKRLTGKLMQINQ